MRARVSVRLSLACPGYRWIGDAGRAVSIETGASACELLFKEYGIDAEHVTATAKESIRPHGRDFCSLTKGLLARTRVLSLSGSPRLRAPREIPEEPRRLVPIPSERSVTS